MRLLKWFSKIFHGADLPASEITPTTKAKRPKNSEVGIVIPIHNAYNDVRRCLASVIRYTNASQPIYCLNDGSTDEKLVVWLEKFAGTHSNVCLISHPSSKGYTFNINLGCQTHPGDVILLNSDTCVTRGWVQGLVDAAYHRDKIATVTPLSNAGGAFSVPENLTVNEIPAGLNIDDIASTISKIATPDYPEVPTGNGFCMYVRHEVFERLGGFDIDNFPIGYGEENDFCFKALKNGYANIIADNVFIYHRRTASFGEKKSELVLAGEKRLKQLHPDYGQAIRDWLDHDPVDSLREKLRVSISQIQNDRTEAKTYFKEKAGDKSPFLYVIFEGEGGTALTNQDLMLKVSGQRQVLMLGAGPDSWSLFSISKGKEILLGRYWFDQTWSSLHDYDSEREEVFKQICEEFQIGLVHFRHLMGLSPEIVKIPKVMQIPVVYSIHDYYPFCPSTNLIDASDHFCRADCKKNFDENTTCADCTTPVIWGVTESFGQLRGSGVVKWRQRFQKAFDQCDALVSTSWELERLFAELFPESKSKLRIIEHGRDLERRNPGNGDEETRQAVPIAFIGHLTATKGAKLIRELLEKNAINKEPFVFHFFGWIDPSLPLPETGMVAHGKYQREELPQLLGELNPAAILIPSICPETYCHTLTEAWANGIPVLAANLGALKERIETHGGGWLLEPHDERAWWNVLKQCLEDPQILESKRAEIAAIPFRSTDDMARDYFELYQQLTSAS